MTEWSLTAVLDTVTDAVPDREMVVWSSARRTYGEVRERTRGLAAFFRDRGLGARQERSVLALQSKVRDGAKVVSIESGIKPERAKKSRGTEEGSEAKQNEVKEISGGPDRTRICDLYRVKVAL